MNKVNIQINIIKICFNNINTVKYVLRAEYFFCFFFYVYSDLLQEEIFRSSVYTYFLFFMIVKQRFATHIFKCSSFFHYYSSCVYKKIPSTL